MNAHISTKRFLVRKFGILQCLAVLEKDGNALKAFNIVQVEFRALQFLALLFFKLASQNG